MVKQYTEKYKSDLMPLLLNSVEKHDEKNTKDPNGIETLKYGVTIYAYNQVLKDSKNYKYSDTPKGLNKYLDKYDVKMANKDPQKAVQRKLSDLIGAGGKQKTELIDYVALRYFDYLERRFNNNTDGWYEYLEDGYKQGLLLAAYQNPDRFFKNRRLMDAIMCNNEAVIKSEVLNHTYKDEGTRKGLQKRAFYSIALMNNIAITDTLDDEIKNKLESDPNFLQDNIKCYEDVENWNKCVQDLNTMVPEIGITNTLGPAPEKYKKRYEEKKQEKDNSSLLESGLKFFEELKNSFINFTSNDKKMQTNGKEVNNGTGNENNNLQ